MKNVLKIMKQPPRVVSPKQPFTQKIIKYAKYLRNTQEGAHFFGGSGLFRGCFSSILLILLFNVRTAVLGELPLMAAS